MSLASQPQIHPDEFAIHNSPIPPTLYKRNSPILQANNPTMVETGSEKVDAENLPSEAEKGMLDHHFAETKGLLPTVGEVKRYGWIRAILRKYGLSAAKVVAVAIALGMMVAFWSRVV